MATSRAGTPGAPGSPHPEPRTPRPHRALPEQGSDPLPLPLPPRRLSPVPHRDPAAAEPSPDPRLWTAALRRLTGADPEQRRKASGGCRLPPLLPALPRRAADEERLRALQPPVPQRLGGTRSASPALRPSTTWPQAAPGNGVSDEGPLRLQPVLGRAIGGDTGPDPLGVRELYRELSKALPSERLRFQQEAPVEPAATAADLLSSGDPGGEAPRHWDPRRWQQPGLLFDDYLELVSDTGFDFLHSVFYLRGEERPAGATEPHREPVPASMEPCRKGLLEPASVEPYKQGLWQPVLPDQAPVELEQLQSRLHRLWAMLGAPEHKQLAIAVKYGTGEALVRLDAALEAWEAAADGVLRRELLLAQLEEHGSDPGGFFRRGPAAVAARVAEARARGHLQTALARCEERLTEAFRYLREGFGNAVTFRGRPYGEKMRRDVVQMLYRLQHCRRAAALQAALGGTPRRPHGPAGAEAPRCQ